MSFSEKHEKTNIFIISKDTWKWAKYKADVLGLESVSEYLFKLIEFDKEKKLLHK